MLALPFFSVLQFPSSQASSESLKKLLSTRRYEKGFNPSPIAIIPNRK
jgi:hypothetical protein